MAVDNATPYNRHAPSVEAQTETIQLSCLRPV